MTWGPGFPSPHNVFIPLKRGVVLISAANRLKDKSADGVRVHVGVWTTVLGVAPTGLFNLERNTDGGSTI